MESLKILAIGDIHYSTRPAEIEERKTTYGNEFLKRVLRRFKLEERPDVVVILGDILDTPLEENEDLMMEIKKTLEEINIPFIPVSGNHDGNGEKFFSVFGKSEKVHFIKDFIFYSFADSYGEGDVCTRSQKDMEEFVSTLKKYPDKRVIVLQHNPVYPIIESSYPYNLKNAEFVHQSYRENGVFLSLSAHYHQGQEISCKDDIYYLTVPALCEEPFRYVMIEIEGKKIDVRNHQLKNSFPFCDNHCHTQFAYCAEDVTIEKVIERAELLGMGYVCFTEHADQLYLNPEEYSKGLSFYQPEIIREKREKRMDRMRLFKDAVSRYRNNSVKIGLEVIPDKDGGISILPEDREGLDIVVGAIHFFPSEILSASSSKRERWFIDMVEVLMKNKVNVLAHPFRVFLRSGLSVPEKLFRPVVELLKSYNVSAELNFHTNTPEHKFFALCIEEGIKISIGSDSHNLLEVGEFSSHMEFLGELGVSPEEFNDILYLLL